MRHSDRRSDNDGPTPQIGTCVGCGGPCSWDGDRCTACGVTAFLLSPNTESAATFDGVFNDLDAKWCYRDAEGQP